MLKVTVPARRQVPVFTRQVITVSLKRQGGNPGQTTDVIKIGPNKNARADWY